MNQIHFSGISKHPVSHPASLSPLHPPDQPVQITDLLPLLLLCSTFPPDDRYLDFGMDHTQCRCLKCDLHPPSYFLSLTDQWGEDPRKFSTVTIEQSAFSGSMGVFKNPLRLHHQTQHHHYTPCISTCLCQELISKWWGTGWSAECKWDYWCDSMLENVYRQKERQESTEYSHVSECALLWCYARLFSFNLIDFSKYQTDHPSCTQHSGTLAEG